MVHSLIETRSLYLFQQDHSVLNKQTSNQIWIQTQTQQEKMALTTKHRCEIRIQNQPHSSPAYIPLHIKTVPQWTQIPEKDTSFTTTTSCIPPEKLTRLESTTETESRKLPESDGAHENDGVQAGGLQELVLSERPGILYPSGGRDEPLEVEVASALGLAIGEQSRHVDLVVQRLFPQDRVEREEQKAQPRVYPHRGQ